jgi:cystathionine beta-lyase/cystathionine gamma-synthase
MCPPSDDTTAVHGGEQRPGPSGSIVFPIYQSTVFSTHPGAAADDIEYIRLSNTPSQKYLHDKLAALEAAEAAVATASGTAAMTATLLTILRGGDHVLAGAGVYGGTFAYMTAHLRRMGIEHTFVDPQTPEAWDRAVTPHTKLFLVEAIGNPLMRIPRLEEVVSFGRDHGLVTVIDNTFATPINLKPLSMGFDVCFHSATKYLNGHSDVVAGCVLGHESFVEAVRKTLNATGGSLDPHAGFLLARGLKTLALRVSAQNANAMRLATFLAAHQRVSVVNYPGLVTHPDHAHAKEVMAGFGGMLSFRVEDTDAKKSDEILARLRVAYVASSLGSIETLVTRPAATSHGNMTSDERATIGITDDLIRVSCGIEGIDDLIADFDHALQEP